MAVWYTIVSFDPITQFIELKLIIDADSDFFKKGIAVLIVKKEWVKFVSILSFQKFSSTSSILCLWSFAALLIRVSIQLF